MIEEPLDDFPPPRPAASARSPRRQARYREVYRIAVRKKLQERFLKAYMAEGNTLRACQLIKTPSDTVYGWGYQYADFRKAWDEVRELIKEQRKGKMDGFVDKAIGVVGETLDQGKDPRLRWNVAERVLEHERLLNRPSERVEHTGPEGGPIEFTLNIGRRPEPVGGRRPELAAGGPGDTDTD